MGMTFAGSKQRGSELERDSLGGAARTTTGPSPTTWELERLGKLAVIKTGAKNTQDRQEDGEYPFFVRSQQVERINSFSHDGEAVLTAGDGVGTGKVFHYINGRFDVHQRVYRISNFSDRLDGRYLFYQFSCRFFDRIMSMTAKSSVDSVRMEMIAGMEIPLPDTREQQAIAAALSDVDGLIASLDRLIAKKRAIKQAAMQQLLTGKTRLPVFSGPWKVRRLGTLVDCLDNLRVPVKESERAAMPGPYPYCGANGVLGHVDRFVLDDDVILMAEDGGYFDEYETRPIAYRMRGKIWVNNHAHILKAKPMECQEFLYYSLVHKNILPYLASGTRAKLNKSEMNKIEIRGPLDFDEQSAIACVLDSSDRELDLLGTRREKAKAVKQGMMQALLTGRVRLPVEATTSGGNA
jgi:type I restriction enzyme, S subunit